MGRQETRWKEFRCEVWRVQCDVWGHGLDSNTATASHKARTHGPGWHTAHASSLVVLGSDSWKLRWHMRRDEVRRDELGWGEKSSDEMKGAVWSVGQEECSVKCEVWSVKCEMWSVECEVWSVECKECSVKCGVWSAKWSFKCDMWNRTPPSQSARTHRLGWRTAHASSIDEKGLIYIFKATSAPPRAGTTGNWGYNPLTKWDEPPSTPPLGFHPLDPEPREASVTALGLVKDAPLNGFSVPINWMRIPSGL